MYLTGRQSGSLDGRERMHERTVVDLNVMIAIQRAPGGVEYISKVATFSRSMKGNLERN